MGSFGCFDWMFRLSIGAMRLIGAWLLWQFGVVPQIADVLKLTGLLGGGGC